MKRRMKTTIMPHPLLNNLPTEKIRQSIIGLALGIVAVTFISPFLGSSHAPQLIEFDSELIRLSSQPADDTEKPEDQSIVADNQLDKNAHLYPFFALHKVALTEKQVETVSQNKPRLSIVLNQVGQNRAMTAAILEKASQDITIGLSTYIRNHNEVAGQLHSYGYETWMDLSVITLNSKTDYGPDALSPVNNFERNVAILSNQLKNKDKLTGVILPNQSLITETPRVWKDLVFDLFAQGYGILDNTKNITKPALFFHDEKRAPYIKGDKAIGGQLSLDELNSILATTRKNVMEQGNMIITLPISTPAHLDILSRWVDSLKQENITIVPLSAQAKL